MALEASDDEVREERREKMFGTLHFSVAYLKENSSVEVNVLRGMDLPALDSNGMLIMKYQYLPTLTEAGFIMELGNLLPIHSL